MLSFYFHFTILVLLFKSPVGDCSKAFNFKTLKNQTVVLYIICATKFEIKLKEIQIPIFASVNLLQYVMN